MYPVMISKDIMVRSYCTKCGISMKSFYERVTTMTAIKQMYLRHGLSECPICGNAMMEPMLLICKLS